MEERKLPGALIDDYTFDSLRRAVETGPCQTLPKDDSPFHIRLYDRDSFIYIKNRDVNLIYSTGIKFHFNFDIPSAGTVEEKQAIIKTGWDAVLPILLENKSVVMSVKVYEPRLGETLNAQNFRSIQTFKESIPEAKGLSQEEKEYLTQVCDQWFTIFNEEINRRESAVITYYIYNPIDGGDLEVKKYETVITQCEAALKNAGIKPGKKPASDFAVGDYTSIRCDRNREGVTIPYNSACKVKVREYSRSHPIIKAFVATSALSELPPFTPESPLLRGSESCDTSDMHKISLYIMKFIQQMVSNDKFVNEVCEDKEYKKLMNEFNKLMALKNVFPSIKFNAFIVICEVYMEGLLRDKMKEATFFVDEKKLMSSTMTESQKLFYDFLSAANDFEWDKPAPFIRFLETLNNKLMELYKPKSLETNENHLTFNNDKK